MDRLARMIEFESAAFPRTDEDDELTNYDSMYGHALARHIAAHLGAHGETVGELIGEDWGWYCPLEGYDFELAYGVSASNDTTDFVVQFMPKSGTIRKFFFKKLDVSEPLERLQTLVFDILSSDRTEGTARWHNS